MNNNIKVSKYDKELEQVNSELHTLVKADRRVISKKHTVEYMIYNAFKDIGINDYKNDFIEGVLNINMKVLQPKAQAILGVWDIVDDFIVGSIIEKTRTRWGKFVPHMAMWAIPLAAITCIFWLLPQMLPASMLENSMNMSKFAIYVVIEMMIELFGNFKNVAQSGYLSTITPYPSDRRRLISVTNFVSGLIGNIPSLGIQLYFDLIRNNIIKTPVGFTQSQMQRIAIRKLGPAAAIISGVVIFWYASKAKERVHQKIEKPKIIDSLKMVLRYRPVLMYMISNGLGSFDSGFSTNDYYKQVLNWSTFETVAGIPSVLFKPIGYSQYNKLASKMPTKNLFVVSQSFAKMLYIPLFFYGILFKDKKGNPFFKLRTPMIIVTALWECVYASFEGVKSVSNNEIYNECNDFIEWKSGCRNEAALSAASAFICKIPGRLNGIITPLIKSAIGYSQEAYMNVTAQPAKAQRGIFALSTIVPAIIILMSMIPMHWYDIDKDTRDRMYRELNERRAITAENITKNGLAEA